MLKILKVVIVLLLVITNFIFSSVVKTKVINSTTFEHVRRTLLFDENSSTEYSFNGSYHIGQYYDAPPFETPYVDEYVSGYYFPLDELPPQEYLISCKLRIIYESAEDNSFTSYVKQLPNAVGIF